MASAGEWCLIESDPGVFTKLIKDFGVTGVQVEELFSLDLESFDHLKPIYGLIFLFKCVSDNKTEGSVVQDNRLDNIFFAKQVISNACATQAIISILLNMNDKAVELGDNLKDFKSFSSSFDANMKGLALSNSEVIRKVHNSFSRPQVFEYDEKLQNSEDAYHFIGYIPIDGRLYEIDGLKPGPIDHGAVTAEDWMETVKPVIQKRMNRYAAGEIHFNLMAIVADVQTGLEKKIQCLTEQIATEKNNTVGDTDKEKIDLIQGEIQACRQRLNEEMEKRQRHHVENIRRKHNYLPFIIEMLRIVAANGQLVSLVESAKDKTENKLKGK